MNQIYAKQKTSSFKGSQQSVLTKAFLAAGIIFLAVFAVGLVTSLFIGRSEIQGTIHDWSKGGYNFSELQNNPAMKKLMYVLVLGGVLGIISFIMTIIWTFRFSKASMTFSYVTIGIYIAAQGAGFGMMFSVFNMSDIIYAFASAGGIFLVCASIGVIMKDASGLLPWIIGLTIVMFLATIVMYALYFAGIFSDQFYLWLTIGSVVLSGLYIIYCMWSLKRMAEWEQAGGQLDPNMKRRLVLFFGFILATQLIRLIWQMLRLIQYFRS